MGVNIIVANRGEGKTTMLLKEASKTDGIVVCGTHKMLEFVSFMAYKLGLRKPRLLTYNDLLDHTRGTRNSLYFDNFGSYLILFTRRQLDRIDPNVKMAMIDRSSIDTINDILSELNVNDLDGKKLRFKIEIEEVEDNIDD